VRRAADSGVSVVLVSSEPDDLVATCDRILVYRSGAGLVDATTTDSDTLIEQIYGRAKAAGSAA
jgi:ABC-type sugar transport system ATPase subunit